MCLSCHTEKSELYCHSICSRAPKYWHFCTISACPPPETVLRKQAAIFGDYLLGIVVQLRVSASHFSFIWPTLQLIDGHPE